MGQLVIDRLQMESSGKIMAIDQISQGLEIRRKVKLLSKIPHLTSGYVGGGILATHIKIREFLFPHFKTTPREDADRVALPYLMYTWPDKSAGQTSRGCSAGLQFASSILPLKVGNRKSASYRLTFLIAIHSLHFLSNSAEIR